jgi:hypothetical protein
LLDLAEQVEDDVKPGDLALAECDDKLRDPDDQVDVGELVEDDEQET